MIINKLSKNISEPAVLVETNRFLVKLAENEDEVKAAQRLRYEVFNKEQKRGLKEADLGGIDEDEFDEYCLHLLVKEKDSNKIIGTYRAQVGETAIAAKGFYTSREFDIRGLDKIADRCLELGRSCVSPEYRHGSVIALLWNAITEILVRSGLTYMLGCVSLDSTDPRIGWALHEYLWEFNHLHRKIKAIPRSNYTLERPSMSDITKALSDLSALKKHIPPLLKAYMRIGATICGEPALDEEFGTIDFCILVDMGKVPYRYIKHFKYPAKR
jgi:putative hemolysin